MVLLYNSILTCYCCDYYGNAEGDRRIFNYRPVTFYSWLGSIMTYVPMYSMRTGRDGDYSPTVTHYYYSMANSRDWWRKQLTDYYCGVLKPVMYYSPMMTVMCLIVFNWRADGKHYWFGGQYYWYCYYLILHCYSVGVQYSVLFRSYWRGMTMTGWWSYLIPDLTVWYILEWLSIISSDDCCMTAPDQYGSIMASVIVDGIIRWASCAVAN